MLFNLKSAFLFGLVTVSYASPIAEPNAQEASLVTLQRRAQVPDEITCDSKKFTKEDINSAIKESKTQHGKYPEKFGNKSGSNKVFDNIPDSTQLWEEPLANPTWTSMSHHSYIPFLNSKRLTLLLHRRWTGKVSRSCER